MATIDTSEDLLRLVREDSDFRATMRRELLTAELLEVPQRLDTMERGIAALLEHAATTNRRLDLIEGDIKQMKGDIDGLGEAFRREAQAQSSYRGAHAQGAASKNRVGISNLFAQFHAIKRTDAIPVRRRVLKSWLQGENTEVVESLNLRERTWETFLEPDIVAEVHDLMADDVSRPEFYIVVEASYTGEAEDIDRATDHAKIVRAVTGLDAYPVVAAVRMDDKMEPDTRRRLYDDVQEFVAANDADAAFWYRLGSADLRPPEPR